MFSTFFESRVVYGIMSKNMVEPEGPKAVWRMRVACWISKVTCTHARTHAQIYVIFIAFPRQERVHCLSYHRL